MDNTPRIHIEESGHRADLLRHVRLYLRSIEIRRSVDRRYGTIANTVFLLLSGLLISVVLFLYLYS